MWKKATSIVFPLLGVLLFGTALVVGVPQRVAKLNKLYELYAPPPLSGVSPRYLNLMLLGHKALYDDFITIWLLQTLTEKTPKDHVQLIEQIRSVIKHRPKVESIYMFSCLTLMMEMKHPEYCKEIVDTGIEVFPMSWRLLMTQGYVEYFALNHPAQAASYFMMAAQRPDAVPFVKKVAAKLIATKELTPEDIQASLDNMAHSEGKSQFADMLRQLPKANQPATTAP